MPVGMDEEQHYESFNMDNDYEGLVEVDGEFLYREKKKKRMQTREDQLYGYQSSDEEDEGFGRRGGKRSKADYTKPVGFVSSGVFVQQPDGDSKLKEQQQQKQQKQQQQQQPGPSKGAATAAGAGLGFETAGPAADLGFSSGSSQGKSGLGSGVAAGAGLGFSGTGNGGLGFRSGGVQTSTNGSADAADNRYGSSSSGIRAAAARQQQLDGSGEDDEEDEAAVLPTAFGRRIKAAAEKKLQHKAAQQKASAERAAARSVDPRFASFEQHTKGIGMKLLEKMGFQAGLGLGKQKQGIAKPIEAKLRPKGMGMGFGDFQEAKMVVEKPAAAAAAAADADAAELEQELAAAVAKTQAPLWKKKAAPARRQRTYKTAEEVLEAAATKPLAAQPILDMRGPQVRLVTDLEQLNQGADAAGSADSGPPMPELAHNMALLVSMTEAQLRRMDASLQHQQDTAALLAQEKERLEQELAAAAAAAKRLNDLTAQLQSVQHQQQQPLPVLQQQYEHMARSYPEEFVLYSISAAALNQVLPLLAQLLQGWQPLLQPELGTAEFKAWRPLLESAAARQSVLAGSWEETGDPYAELVMQVVLPPVRTAITHWEPRQPEPLLTWFDLWGPLLPRGASQQLLQGLVLPRIAAAVEAWDPTRETQPIHAWLHPWLPHLAAELQSIYPTIRHRLTRALTAWHPSDASARVLLGPWQSVFDPSDWEALLQRSIMPKLAQSLQAELVLNPLSPHLDPFHWALSWHGLMPTGHLAALMESCFFPAWHALLHHWLSHSPNYDEVTRWYLDWKAMFPQDALDHPRVRAGFSQALNMMNSAADGQPLPSAAAPSLAEAAAGGSVPSWRAEVSGVADTAAAASAGRSYGRGGAASAAEPSFKDLVAQYAQEQGFEFLPRAGRLHDGLQVYSFGGVSCVVDAAHSLVRAQLKDRGWVPVSLEKLREEAALKRGVS